VVKGGQFATQDAEEQADFVLLSEVNRYSARPDPSVTKLPISPLADFTVTAEVDAVAAPLDEGVLVEADVLDPPHAAASTATAASGTPSPTVEDSFLTESTRIQTVSCVSSYWTTRSGALPPLRVRLHSLSTGSVSARFNTPV
jgi:hypothetical protein